MPAAVVSEIPEAGHIDSYLQSSDVRRSNCGLALTRGNSKIASCCDVFELPGLSVAHQHLGSGLVL